jgi:hypothetical protein
MINLLFKKNSIRLFRVILAPHYRLNQFQFRQALPARLRDYVRGGGATSSGIFFYSKINSSLIII